MVLPVVEGFGVDRDGYSIDGGGNDGRVVVVEVGWW